MVKYRQDLVVGIYKITWVPSLNHSSVRSRFTASEINANIFEMKFFVVVVFCLAAAAAMPFELVEDENGEQYYAVPVSREKRQTKWGVSNSGYGLSHQGTILNNNNHRLDGSAYAAKNFGSHGLRPDQFGGRLDYAHKPSGSSAFVGADNTRHFGTDVNAGVKYNIYQRKNLGVDVTGQYGRHFGGPGGNSRPNAGVFLNANARF